MTYSRASDVWSLACLILEMVTREPPYGRMATHVVVKKVATKQLGPCDVLSKDPRAYEPGVIDLVAGCSAFDPAERLAMSEVLEAAGALEKI
jgi:serine/threonine protein kinase